MKIKIIKAEQKHIKEVGILFDLYRQFYKYESNLIESTNYIKDRINNKESIIFIAINDNNEAIGFVQLYETFGSLDLGKIIILYDLYVKKSADCVISVFEPDYSPAKAYKLNGDGTIEGLLFSGAPYCRRQDLPKSFQPNGAIYIFSTDVFMLDKLIPRTKVYPYMMNRNTSIDIDTMDDLIEAELYLERMNNV